MDKDNGELMSINIICNKIKNCAIVFQSSKHKLFYLCNVLMVYY